LDLEMCTGAVPGVSIGARVKNLFDQEIETVQFAPKLERTFSFLISGTF
jgi:hypothetical protein